MKSKVFFSSLLEPGGISELLEVTDLGKIISPDDLVALKLHFGEKGNRGYIKPRFITPLAEKVKSLKGRPFLTDTNTIYRGERDNAFSHLQIAEAHGFGDCGVPLIIADGLRGTDYVKIKVNGRHFKEVKIASSIFYANVLIGIAHFKGHVLTGFGGCLKNIGMGCASRVGKYTMHAGILPKFDAAKCIGCGDCVQRCPGNALEIRDKKLKITPAKCIGCGECISVCQQGAWSIPWDDSPRKVQEKMVEYASATLQNKRAIFINFLNFITKDCDCLETDAGPLIEDIGVVAGFDPVAIDQASVDLVNQQAGKDLFLGVHPEADWRFQLDYAEELGLGAKDYELVRIR